MASVHTQSMCLPGHMCVVHVCAGVHVSVCACVHMQGLGGQACAGLCCSLPFPGGEFGLIPLFQVDGIDSGGRINRNLVAGLGAR